MGGEDRRGYMQSHSCEAIFTPFYLNAESQSRSDSCAVAKRLLRRADEAFEEQLFDCWAFVGFMRFQTFMHAINSSMFILHTHQIIDPNNPKQS